MDTCLSDVEVRVLGVLMEKAVTTPDQYPLSLNALTLGCNQRTSRFPVTDYSESEVTEALLSLRDRGLVYRVDQAGSRVAKFEHRLLDVWELTQSECALLSVLLLRGPQTPGQLRQRAERQHVFKDIEQVVRVLESLALRTREPETLVEPLPLQAGSKEVRYRQVFGKWSPGDADGLTEPDPAGAIRPSQVELLAERVATLEGLVDQMRRDFEDFRKQFE